MYHVLMATIQVRTNDGIKKVVQRILANLGMDLSTAINMYLYQIARKNGIPFEILTKNGMTRAEEQEILQEMDWALKYGKRYVSAKEMHDDILRE